MQTEHLQIPDDPKLNALKDSARRHFADFCACDMPSEQISTVDGGNTWRCVDCGKLAAL